MSLKYPNKPATPYSQQKEHRFQSRTASEHADLIDVWCSNTALMNYSSLSINRRRGYALKFGLHVLKGYT